MRFAIREGSATVEAWADSYLPFEFGQRADAKDLLAFRGSLRRAISRMRAGRILGAEFASARPVPGDVENLAFYNIGGGVFGQPTTVHFRRAHRVPDGPLDVATVYYRYWTSDGETCEILGPVLAEWEGVQIHGPVTVASVWQAMREHSSVVVHGRSFESVPIGLVLSLSTPSRGSAIAFIKPLIDGVVSAFHRHVDTPKAAKALALPPAVVALLGDDALNVLGPRRVVWPRASGVQWNPADDRCAQATIHVVRGDRTALSGRLVLLSA